MAMTVLRVSDEYQVNTQFISNQSDPYVTKLPDGGWLVTWSSDVGDSNLSDIFMQRYDADGRPQYTDGNGAPQEVRVNAAQADAQLYSTVTTLSDGGWVIAWRSTGSSSDIHMQRYDASGRPLFTDGAGNAVDQPVNMHTSGDQMGVSLTALSDGGWIATWHSRNQDGSGQGVYMQRYDAQGEPQFKDGNGDPVDTLVNASTAGDQWYAVTSALPDGGWVVVWYGDPAVANSEIYMQRYNALGEPQYPADHRVNAVTAKVQRDPSITTLADGGWIVTWDSYGQDGSGSGNGVYMQRYDAQGEPQFKDGSGNPVEVRVSDASLGEQKNSSVAALPNGGWVVTWDADYDVHQRFFNADGTPASPDLVVAAWLGSEWNKDSVVTVVGPDRWVATWENYNQDGAVGTGVAQRVFQATHVEVLTTAQEMAVGSSAQETLQVAAGGLSEGDSVDGGAGTDTLLMIESGVLDLTKPARLNGFEVVHGTAGDDTVIANAARLANFTTIDGKGGNDTLQLSGGGTLDLRGKTLAGFGEIELTDTLGTTVTVDNAATAMLMNGRGTGDRVNLEGGIFSEEQIIQLFLNGIETVADGNGVRSHSAPIFSNLAGDAVDVVEGGTVRIDLGANATIMSDSPTLDYLLVRITNWVSGEDRLGIAEGGSVTLSNGVATGSIVSVNDIEIGTIAQNGSGAGGLKVDFQPAATATLVQSLIRAITYTNLNDTDPATVGRSIAVTLRDGLGASSTATVTAYVNPENDPPVLGGPGSVVRGLDTDLLLPFAGVSVTDMDSPNVTVTIAPNDSAKGVFVNTDLVDPQTGIFTVTGTATQVTAAVRALQFNPTDRPNSAVGSIETASFTVTVNDGESGEASFTVNAESAAANRAPQDVLLSGGAVTELAALNTQVAVFGAYDPNAGESFTYTLLNPDGRFKIAGNQLLVDDGFKLDFEQARSHQVTVQVTDQGGLSYVETLTIAVADVRVEKTRGGVGHDVIKGGKYNDVIGGGAGNDKLWGGLGRDVLTGGKGKDTFVFNTKPNKKTNLDKIVDFNVKDDTVWLDNAIFKKLGKGTELKPGKLNKAFFTIGDSAKDANDYLIYDNKKGVLYYDVDGSGAKAAVEIATLKKGLKMTAADFMII